jgi:DNA-binding SARP family transcriptional activator
MADLGRANEAFAAARQGRELTVRSGALSTMLHFLFEAMLELRLHGDPAAAAAALARVEAFGSARRRLRVLEQLELWHGLVGLLSGDAVTAAEYLRRAVGLMVEWDRLLLLPPAAVYLAEAEWRLGDEEAADAAADRALEAAERQGSNHLFLQALHEFPAVVSRRLDAQRGTDSRWHAIGRLLLSEPPAPGGSLTPHVHVREVGSPAIVIDGRGVQPKLTRSVELLACLAAHGGDVGRRVLLEELFGGRADDSARSYLRQAIRGLRDVLGDDAPLLVDADRIAWTDDQLTSDSIALRRDVQQAQLLHGRDRLAALTALIDPGEFLPEARSPWADERREALRRLLLDARLAAAEIAFELGELEQAEAFVQGVLREDPHRESAWRLSMRIAGALGQEDRVIARFRDCRAALAEVATVPADSTRRLLEQLRR